MARPTAALVVAAGVVGAATGLVAGSFRLALDAVTRLHLHLVRGAHPHHLMGLVAVVAGGAAATAAAAWLVHRIEPHAEGSGIPRVEAIVEGRIEPGRFRILPVKYVGGLLSMGSGLALGREGPSVQMGGSIAAAVGRLAGRSAADVRLLVGAGAAAGLATAFNAPIAGGVFVLEELMKRFDPKASLATLSASASGFVVAHLLVHDTTIFHVAGVGRPRLAEAPVVALLGLLAGAAGLAYNRSVMAGLRWADTSRRHPVVRGAAIGGLLGLVAWWAPRLVGGGDNLTQDALLGSGTVVGVLGILAARWVLGVVSYAALTPGGLFAPMLVIGACLGDLVGLVAARIAPADTPGPGALALIGMAAFFAATVRAPVTGLVLATEMTGSTMLLPPMLGACALAMAVPTMLRAAPLYDLLALRSARAAALNAADCE